MLVCLKIHFDERNTNLEGIGGRLKEHLDILNSSLIWLHLIFLQQKDSLISFSLFKAAARKQNHLACAHGFCHGRLSVVSEVYYR